MSETRETRLPYRALLAWERLKLAVSEFFREPSRDDLTRWMDEGEPVTLAATDADGKPIQMGEQVVMRCSACGKPKPNDLAWARPVMGCECGNTLWTGTVRFRG